MWTRIWATLQMVFRLGQFSGVTKGFNAWARYTTLTALREGGLFDYLEEPRSYNDILTNFGFQDNDYTRDVFEVLSDSRDPVLLHENGQYRRNPDVPLPPPWEIYKSTVPPLLMAFYEPQHQRAELIPVRMSGTERSHEELFQERETMIDLDDLLQHRLYDALRQVAHTWARPYLKSLDGKTLLDVGCGSGRETAHLWLQLEGRVKITATDSVASFIDAAQERFSHLVRELSGGSHPPITDENRPTFITASATELDFPAESFDMVFHSATLYWTPDPQEALRRMFAALKPGGLIYGVSGYRPQTSGYLHLILRVSENVYGFPWEEEMKRWYREGGAEFDELSGGIHRGIKQG